MAYVPLPEQPGEPLQLLGPLSLRQNLGAVVSYAWMSKGARGNDPAFIRDLVNRMLNDAIEWWKELPAIFKLEGSHVSQGLDRSGANLQDNARMMLRQSVQHCWMMLPLSRRSTEEVLRLIGQMFDDLFVQIQLDFDEFRRA